MVIGSVLYHAADLAERTDLIDAIIGAAGAASGGTNGPYYRSIVQGSTRGSRRRRLQTNQLRELKADVAGRVLTAAQLDFPVAGQSRISLNLDLWLTPAVTARRTPFPYEVKLIGPADDQSERINRFVVLVRQCAELMDASYGIVYLGNSYEAVQTELDAIPSSMLGEAQSRDHRTHMEWLGFWQRHRDAIGEYVRKAYWGNVLGRGLVAELGGLERVRSDARADVIEPLRNGGLYLQACRTRDSTCPEEQRLDALTSYLAPISLQRRFPHDAPDSAARR